MTILFRRLWLRLIWGAATTPGASYFAPTATLHARKLAARGYRSPGQVV